MKKILLFLFIVFIVFLIYKIYVDKNIYYLSIGDYLSYGINNKNKVENNYNNYFINKCKVKKYINYSTIDDYRVMDLINDINYNKKIVYNDREYRIQNLLIKSNIITISIGMNDLIYKNDINLNYINRLLTDIENLIITIRKYNKDKIYFLGFYNVINNNDLINYSNKKMKAVCKRNKVIFIDISNLNNYIINNKYPSNAGYSYIVSRFTK